jgi:hypothetical protein
MVRRPADDRVVASSPTSRSIPSTESSPGPSWRISRREGSSRSLRHDPRNSFPPHTHCFYDFLTMPEICKRLLGEYNVSFPQVVLLTNPRLYSLVYDDYLFFFNLVAIAASQDP